MRFRYLSPDEGGSGSGSAASGGSKGAAGSAGQPNGGEGGDGAGGAAGQKSKEQLEQENRFITREALRGILDAKDRSFKEDLGKIQTSLESKLEGINKALETAASSHKKEGSKNSPGEGSVESPELIELRRQNKELQESISKVKAAHDEAQRRERDFRFKTTVTDALVRKGCLKPEKVYRMIAPDLKTSEDGNEVFALVKSEFGEEKLTVDQFIERYVAKEEVPELFKGQTRQGAPAGGDSSGGGDGKFLFRMSQLKDPKFYSDKNNIEKVRSALEKGQVDLTK